MRLDHLAIAAETLEEGVDWAEERFGVTFLGGGKHARFGTHNQLLGLEHAIYLEVIAVDPDVQCVGPRWFELDDFKGPPRLVNWICEPAAFEESLLHGMQSVPMARGDLRWNMGARPDGLLPMGGGYPTVLQWHTDTPPGVQLQSSGWDLERLTISHPRADEIADGLRSTLRDPRVCFEVADTIQLGADFLNGQGRKVSL